MERAAGRFTLMALRRKERRLEEEKIYKMRQIAARLILHSLLLNCWRNTRRELDGKLVDDGELREIVENLQLQVQWLRHVQAGERRRKRGKGGDAEDGGRVELVGGEEGGEGGIEGDD